MTNNSPDQTNVLRTGSVRIEWNWDVEEADRFLDLVNRAGFWQSIDLRVCAIRRGRSWVNLVTRGFLDHRTTGSVPAFSSVDRQDFRAWQVVLPITDLPGVVHGMVSGAARLGAVLRPMHRRIGTACDGDEMRLQRVGRILSEGRVRPLELPRPRGPWLLDVGSCEAGYSRSVRSGQHHSQWTECIRWAFRSGAKILRAAPGTGGSTRGTTRGPKQDYHRRLDRPAGREFRSREGKRFARPRARCPAGRRGRLCRERGACLGPWALRESPCVTDRPSSASAIGRRLGVPSTRNWTSRSGRVTPPLRSSFSSEAGVWTACLCLSQAPILGLELTTS